ncbi:hypothetical protein NC653_018139 [Populus alba x Populus x berolinensis]|uniref:Uncharacterized protein n=1 Tax=Populus alba x Populus x berolinensis TaxID=444605 RepID=A0AAD6W1E6_9ROSI|nr:hypothetical protein NC653_018139 [Populus alba x Populus x berolinensis]
MISLWLVKHTRDETWSLPMQGVIPCDAAITCLHLSLKILPFLALYTAMETVTSLTRGKPCWLSSQPSYPLTLFTFLSKICGCRADANEAAVILLPSNITVFALDFSGSGLSDGDYVSLGWHERDDPQSSGLVSKKQQTNIMYRPVGTIHGLLYGAEDPSIAGMVLDSAFANLFDLMMELVDVYKIRLPKFTVKMASTVHAMGDSEEGKI